MQDLKIALIQDELHWEDAKANRAHFDGLLEQIGDADLVLLPEMFNTGFTVKPEHVAEPVDGPSVQWMRDKAVEKGFAIAASLIISEEGRYYNRLVFMHPDGSMQYYDKRHLFRMGGEHERFGMGMHRLVVEYKGWKILPLVCYDLRFPVWSRNRLIEGKFEYDFAFYVANWPEARSHPWKSLLTARAIENQAYVAGLNRVGSDGQGISYSGDSRIIDAKGNILAEGDPGERSIIRASLSAEDLHAFRNKFKVGLDWDQFSIQGVRLS